MKQAFLLLCCLFGGGALGAVAGAVLATLLFGIHHYEMVDGRVPVDPSMAGMLGGQIVGVVAGGVIFLRGRRRGVWKDSD